MQQLLYKNNFLRVTEKSTEKRVYKVLSIIQFFDFNHLIQNVCIKVGGWNEALLLGHKQTFSVANWLTKVYI